MRKLLEVLEKKLGGFTKEDLAKLQVVFGRAFKRDNLTAMISLKRGGSAVLTFAGPSDLFDPPGIQQDRIKPGSIWMLSKDGFRARGKIERWIEGMGYYVPMIISDVNCVVFQRDPEAPR